MRVFWPIFASAAATLLLGSCSKALPDAQSSLYVTYSATVSIVINDRMDMRKHVMVAPGKKVDLIFNEVSPPVSASVYFVPPLSRENDELEYWSSFRQEPLLGIEKFGAIAIGHDQEAVLLLGEPPVKYKLSVNVVPLIKPAPF